MTFTRTPYIRIVLTILCIVALGGPIAAQPELTVLRVGVTPADDMTAALYAQKQGMFKRAGLDVQFDASSASGAAVAAGVIAGAYDIGKAGTTAMIDAHLRGLPFMLIAGAAMNDIKAPFMGLIVAKDSPYHTVKDLANATVSISALRDFGQLALMKSLDDAGIPATGVHYIEIPFAMASAAIETRRVDAATVVNPQLQAAIDSGKMRFIPILATFGTIATSSWFTTKDVIAKKDAAIVRFSRVLFEAARYTNHHPAETVQLLADYTKISPDVIRHLARVENGTGITASAIQPLIDASAKYGFISRSFPADEMIDPSVEALR